MALLPYHHCSFHVLYLKKVILTFGFAEGKEREPRIQLHQERYWDRNLKLVVTVKPEVLGSSGILWEELGFTGDSEMA